MLYKTFTTIYSEKIGNLQSWGNIIEIGAGYGCLALNLIRTGKASSYTIIDLYENLLNSFYFLSNTIPSDWKICIVYSIPLSSLRDKTIYLLSPGYINSLVNINYDIALNSDSLGEMPKITAFSYIKWIRQLLKPNSGIFLSKNGHLRSSVGVDRITSYGYDQFELIDFRPSLYSSSALDDFSHFITLKNSQKLWSKNQIKYIDVIGDLIRCGLSVDLNDLINRFLKNNLNEDDLKILDLMILNFANKQFNLTGNNVIDFYFGFMNSMSGMSSKNESVDCAIGYLQIGLSPHARIYAYSYLFKCGIIGSKLIKIESAMVRYFCNLFFKEIIGIKGFFKYQVRSNQLRLKITPRTNKRDSFIIYLKNIYMNLKEGRGFSVKRGF